MTDFHSTLDAIDQTDDQEDWPVDDECWECSAILDRLGRCWFCDQSWIWTAP